MAELSEINSEFSQKGPICVMASYGIVLEYFSYEKIKVRDVLMRYLKYYKLNSHKFETKNKSAKQHNEITKHFHEYCVPKNLRGFEFIVELHNNDKLGITKYCNIEKSNALQETIPVKEVDFVKSYLKDNDDSLAMVIYPIDQRTMHTVVVGFDYNEQKFFVKDPEKTLPFYNDIFDNIQVYEYIIFQGQLDNIE
jgi:hypothetical protein